MRRYESEYIIAARVLARDAVKFNLQNDTAYPKRVHVTERIWISVCPTLPQLTQAPNVLVPGGCNMTFAPCPFRVLSARDETCEAVGVLTGYGLQAMNCDICNGGTLRISEMRESCMHIAFATCLTRRTCSEFSPKPAWRSRYV